jgi:hypothetical protein
MKSRQQSHHVSISEFPWMALLSMGCGGALINSRYVLTGLMSFAMFFLFN